MKEGKEIWLLILSVICSSIAVGISLGRCSKGNNERVVCDTITIVTHDTITITKPIAEDSSVVGKVVRRLPLYRGNGTKDSLRRNGKPQTFEPNPSKPYENGMKNAGTEILQQISTDGSDTITADSADVFIPIEQKVYSDTSYRAWVSGYMASLDSIQVYPRTVTRTVEKIAKAQRPSPFGVSVGIGLTAAPGHTAPGIFLGLSYTLWRW